MESTTPRRIAVLVLAAAFLAACVWALWPKGPGGATRFHLNPHAVMGTQTKLTAVLGANEGARARQALERAERALRDVETKMSSWLDSSELSRFNTAPASEITPLSPETLQVLQAARTVARDTNGAFDVTCRPIIELWKQAKKTKKVPAAAMLAAAREQSRWDHIEILPDGATKTSATASVDLGGIAKGFGIDQAAEALIVSGAVGGLVDVGGDIRCFGRRDTGGAWQVGIRSPFTPEESIFAVLSIGDGAVCTSGNYLRYAEIDGKRYSHIVDPRMGWPVDAAPSVTVVAKTAMTADAWATALSVLGAAGLKLLPAGEGIEAMIVEGGPDDYRIHYSDGFEELLSQRPPAPKKGG